MLILLRALSDREGAVAGQEHWKNMSLNQLNDNQEESRRTSQMPWKNHVGKKKKKALIGEHLRHLATQP